MFPISLSPNRRYCAFDTIGGRRIVAFFLLFGMAFAATAARAQLGVEVKIEGPESLDWNGNGRFEIKLYENGVERPFFPEVKWSLEQKGPGPVSIDDSRSKILSVATGAAPNKYGTTRIRLTAVVTGSIAGGTKIKRRVRRIVSVSARKRNCDALKARITQMERDRDATAAKLGRLRNALAAMSDSEKPDTERLDALKRTIKDREQDLADARKIESAARDLRNAFQQRKMRLNKPWSATWLNMSEQARIHAAKMRYRRSGKTDRDKLAFVHTVFGKGDGIPLNHRHPQLPNAFDEAVDHVNSETGALAAHALGLTGQLVLLGAPEPSGQGRRITEIIHELVKGANKLKSLSEIETPDHLLKQAEFDNKALRAAGRRSAKIRALASQYNAIKAQNPDDRRLGDLRRRLLIEIKAMHNAIVDAQIRAGVSEDIAAKYLREALKEVRRAEKKLSDARADLAKFEKHMDENEAEAAEIRRQRAALRRQIRDSEIHFSYVSQKLPEAQAAYEENCRKKEGRVSAIPEDGPSRECGGSITERLQCDVPDRLEQQD